MGEGEYLEDQCRRAKAGMRLAMRDLRRDAIQSADPRRWARTHPWATVGAAALAGFAASRVVQRELIPVEAPKAHPLPVDHRPGRVARFLSMVVKIFSLAQPLVRAAMIEHMNRAQSIQHPTAA